MPIRKWMFQYAIALPLVFGLFAGVQLLKGRSVDYALEFGALWAVISIGIFAVNRVYQYRCNVSCAICSDLPNPHAAKDQAP